jgi:hypothetical protein
MSKNQAKIINHALLVHHSGHKLFFFSLPKKNIFYFFLCPQWCINDAWLLFFFPKKTKKLRRFFFFGKKKSICWKLAFLSMIEHPRACRYHKYEVHPSNSFGEIFKVVIDYIVYFGYLCVQHLWGVGGLYCRRL